MGIDWDRKSYLISGNRNFLKSGEFHYFRVPRQDWKRRLELFIKAGGNCVATYIPWALHEPVEGDITFDRDSGMELCKFLELCGELGLLVICRPGPYQYSEMIFGGLPEWLCRDYPQILARRGDGSVIRDDTVSYLHPVFLEKARKWFHAVGPILKKYSVENGGPVALIQLDNELMGFHIWRGSLDYNREAMGIGMENGRYPAFLKKKYGSLEEINRQYGMKYGSCKDIVPCLKPEPENRCERRSKRDYQEFYFQTVAEYVSVLAEWLREEGVHTGLIHNSGNPSMNSYYKETVERMGDGFLLGGDHYYCLGPGWAQNNPTPQYAIKVFCSNEMFRLMGFPPTVLELPAGSACDWPPITASDLESCYMTNLALGMKGFNYYIFTGCDGNPYGLSFKTDYDYGAPVSGDGNIRPHYDRICSFHRFLEENQWLANADMEVDFYLGMNWEDSRSDSYFRKGEEFSGGEAWEFVRKGLLPSAFCAAYIPGFVDLTGDEWLQKKDRPLVVATSACMAEEIQRKLIRYVQEGGILLLLPVIPSMDEDFHPCTLLQDYLGRSIKGRHPTYRTKSRIGELQIGNIPFFSCENRPEVARTIAVEEYQQLETGWIWKQKNAGTVLWLGYYWEHCYKEHSSLLKYLLKLAGCTCPKIECENPNLWAVVRSDGKRRMAFVMNLFSSEMKGHLAFQCPDGQRKELGEIRLKPMEVWTCLLDDVFS